MASKIQRGTDNGSNITPNGLVSQNHLLIIFYYNWYTLLNQIWNVVDVELGLASPRDPYPNKNLANLVGLRRGVVNHSDYLTAKCWWYHIMLLTNKKNKTVNYIHNVNNQFIYTMVNNVTEERQGLNSRFIKLQVLQFFI